MPYTLADFRREHVKERLKDFTPEERLKGLTPRNGPKAYPRERQVRRIEHYLRRVQEKASPGETATPE